MDALEFTFRTPQGRLTESFHPMTTLHEVRKRIGRAIGCEVADLLVGFPPKPIQDKTLEAVGNNQVITIAEDSQKLTQAVDHTGKTYDDIGELFAEQPKEDFIPLIDGLKEYSGMLSTYPEIMQVHRSSVTKVKEFQKLKEEDKVEDDVLEEVCSRADTITAVSFAEMNHFHQLRIKDFKSMMQNFLREQMSFHQKIIDKLEESYKMFDSV